MSDFLLPWTTKCSPSKEMHSADEISNYVKHHGSPALILGGGSNMLLTKDIKGDVLKVDIHGRRVVFEDDEVDVSFEGGTVGDVTGDDVDEDGISLSRLSIGLGLTFLLGFALMMVRLFAEVPL